MTIDETAPDKKPSAAQQKVAQALASQPPDIKTLFERTHIGTALRFAASIENILEGVLESRMPEASKSVLDTLYENNGPLSTFSGKIKIARAFGFIPASLAAELHKIREIRNRFAHANDFLTFDDPAIVDRISKLEVSPPHEDHKDPVLKFGDAVKQAMIGLGECWNPPKRLKADSSSSG